MYSLTALTTPPPNTRESQTRDASVKWLRTFLLRSERHLDGQLAKGCVLNQWQLSHITGSMATVLDPAEVCIYCGSLENLTTEHIVPFSLGGDVELPASSCPTCSALTSAIELRVSRHALHIPRAMAGYPSRRRKGYPEKVEVHFSSDDGSKVTRFVDIDEAPTVHIVPLLPLAVGRNQDADELLSCVTFEYRNLNRNGERLKALGQKYGYSRAMVSASLFWSDFHRLIWKMAAGLFWNYDPDAYWKSRCRDRVLTGRDIYSSQRLYDLPRIGFHDHCVDMYSLERAHSGGDPRIGHAHCGPSEDGRWLYATIDILEPLGFPIYVCRIPAASTVYPWALQHFSGPRHLSPKLFVSVEFSLE